ncbi:hypothetical protein JX265_012012 [Neoarthrinium moseri]|uniref:NAD(P)-binding protein n=1 Tax=Neoarthrinium moseri TaxID=1658444 RepID=A0A9P9WBG6_9PEZI|nr:hypothetical protein JX265_012012 [Neoarthrinium moseri]
MPPSADFIPPSFTWSLWQSLKGTYTPKVTVPDAGLRGKWVLITGSNNGIGREAAIRFARSGANLVLACRQPPSHETHPEQVVEECRAAGGGHAEDQIVEWWECDMADLSSVQTLAQRWNDTGRPLDILANNAGIPSTNRHTATSKDGFELCHQVNFLSHTLLTLSVLPSIAKAPSPRIVCTTSCLHYLGVYNLSNANTGVDAYANNKLYFQIWLTELQVRLLQHPDYAHIVVHGVHPGYVNSGIWARAQGLSLAAFMSDPIFWISKILVAWVGIDPHQGALAIYNAATSHECGMQSDGADEFRGGAKYFNLTSENEPSPYTRDAASRKDVWEFIVGELGLGKKFHITPELERMVLD